MTVRGSVKFVLAAVLAIGNTQCGGGDSDEDSGSGEAEKLQLALSDATASESLSLADQTLTSMDAALEESAGSLVIELLEDSEEVTYASKYCSDAGDPLLEPSDDFTSLTLNEWEDTVFSAAGDGGLNAGHPNYPARRFHCQLKINSESPDTIRGAYAFTKGILCAAENAEGIDWDDPGEKDVTIEFTDTCFGEKFLAEMGDVTEAGIRVTTELLEDEDGWDRSVFISRLAVGGEVDEVSQYYFVFSNSKEGIAVKHWAIDGDSPNNKSGWTFALDSDGELRYERKNYNEPGDDDEYGSDFVRLYAKGSVEIEEDDDGKPSSSFTAIEALEGIYTRMYEHPDAEANGADAGEVLTIKGTAEAGFETRAFSCNSAVASDEEYSCDGADADTYEAHAAETVENGYSTCIPSDSDCDGVDALEFGSGDEAVVMNVSSSDDLAKTPREWIDEMEQPLSFEAITFDYIQE